MKLENYQRQLIFPIAIYADTEALLNSKKDGVQSNLDKCCSSDRDSGSESDKKCNDRSMFHEM